MRGLAADLRLSPERADEINLSIVKRIEVKVAPHAAILGTAAAASLPPEGKTEKLLAALR